jgi:RNase P/RNase MRP subunit p29
MNVLNSSTQSDVNIVGNKSEEEQNSLCIKLTKKMLKVKGKKRSLTIKQDRRTLREEKG